MKLTIHTDGGARGNPGPAAVGIVIDQDGKTIHEFGKTLGTATNNVAEYTAVIEAFQYILSHLSSLNNLHDIDFFLDSALVVNQLNGLFKVKNANLRMLLAKIRSLESHIGGNIRYTYVPREQNKRADLLVNRALDEESR